jgi:predicted ATP-grasp superfamily ATP-dependent carboligase
VIVGASARAAAWSLRWAGHYVTAIDLFADQDLHAIAHRVQSVDSADYPENLVPIVQRLVEVPDRSFPPLDGLVYVGGLENHPRLLDQFRSSLPVWGPHSAALDHLRDPLRWMPKLASLGWRCPVSRRASPTAPGQWLFKPDRSAGGRRIGFNAPAFQLPSERGYFQQFVPGPSYAGIFLGTPQANYLCGVTRQWISRDVVGHSSTTSEPFAYVGSVTCSLDLDQCRSWEVMAEALLDGAKLLGLWGLDAIDAGAANGTIGVQPEFSQLVPIEVNPRYTASVEVLERARGASWLRDHLRVFVTACNHNLHSPPQDAITPRLSASPPMVWGKRILYAPSNISMHAQALKCVRDLCRQARPRLRLVDIPTIPQDIERGRPLFTLLASGDDRTEVECQLGFTESSTPLMRILDCLGA